MLQFVVSLFLSTMALAQSPVDTSKRKDLEINGISLGLKEVAIVKLFPKIACTKREKITKIERTCYGGLGKAEIPNKLKKIGTYEVLAFEIDFVKDKTISVMFYVNSSDFEKVVDVFSEKFGKSQELNTEATSNPPNAKLTKLAVWSRKKSELRLDRSFDAPIELSRISLVPKK